MQGICTRITQTTAVHEAKFKNIMYTACNCAIVAWNGNNRSGEDSDLLGPQNTFFAIYGCISAYCCAVHQTVTEYLTTLLHGNQPLTCKHTIKLVKMINNKHGSPATAVVTLAVATADVQLNCCGWAVVSCILDTAAYTNTK